METLRFLSPAQAESIRAEFGTPVFVYDHRSLLRHARNVLRFPNEFGLTARYAMKASPNAALLRVFHGCGLHMDASSGYEVQRARRAGIPAESISLSSQEFPANFADLHRAGVAINACSLHQVNAFGKIFRGDRIGIRFNPGFGSGGSGKTNVGGPAASFGIWHESLEEVQQIIRDHELKVIRIHTHIGSGSDPHIWQGVALMSLDLVEKFPSVNVLNLGGGFKVARTDDETTTDLQRIGAPVQEAFVNFKRKSGRSIHLEIEPGTYLVANACSLLTTVQDIADTGDQGYRFLKLDTGMTEILRPSLYGAQHPIVTVPSNPAVGSERYIVVGHCCESGDLLTTAAGEPEVLAARELARAQIGDLCVIEGVGAYCSAMSAKNYNSFPEAPEVMLMEDGNCRQIRLRQTLEQMTANEVPIPAQE